MLQESFTSTEKKGEIPNSFFEVSMIQIDKPHKACAKMKTKD